MNTELIDWEKPTTMYILIADAYVKFGITYSWLRREKAYEKELNTYPFRVIKQIEFDARWQAELIEQIVKWRLRKWAVHGRHEWIELPIQPVLDCIHHSIKEIKPEYGKHKYIHSKGTERWDFYKQIAQYYFKDKS